MSDRRDFIKSLLAGGAGIALSSLSNNSIVSAIDPARGALIAVDDPWSQASQILARIRAPVFPARDFPITKFGAIANGKTDCTEALARAIEACNKAGGGRVVVPAGEFLTGAIHLKSNVNLYLAKNSTIKFSQDPKKYLPVVFTRWEGMELMSYSPFIYAFEQKNIAITGEGIIDGEPNATDQTGPNTDGCDPESCRDVLIENCIFATGDDCIAINSGRNNDGRRVAVPSENIIIRGCQMKDGHGGITVGSQISAGVRNVFAENCHMDSPNLWIALRFKNNALRGGRLENFYFRNIEVGQVRDAVLTVDFNYEEGEKGPFTPVVRNVVVNNLRSGKSARALDLQGFKNAPIYNVRLENCTFDNVAKENVVKNVQGLELKNVRINGKVVSEAAG